MPLTRQQIAAAEVRQRAAAHETSARVRLVAGPGTGKSRVIDERVCWLLEQGVRADRIFVISFTRGAARAAKARIGRYCDGRRVIGSHQVNVTMEDIAWQVQNL